MSIQKVVYLPEAIDDLHGIWAFVAEQSKSLEVADRLVDAIDDAALLYAASPHTGVPRLDLAPNLRCLLNNTIACDRSTVCSGCEIDDTIWLVD